MVFLLKKNDKADNNSVTKRIDPSFNFKSSREIKGIELLPFHINNFDKAIANKDFDLANLSFAKAIELVRQKNEDENNKHEDFLASLHAEYTRFREAYNLEYPQQFLPPSQRKKKTKSEDIEKLKANHDKDLNYHFQLGEKISSYYKHRETGDNLEKAIKACEQQIEFAPKAKAALKYLYKREPLPSHQGYNQLAIIKEKQNKIDEAIALCIAAKKQGWSDDWDKRLDRLQKKQAKSADT